MRWYTQLRLIFFKSWRLSLGIFVALLLLSALLVYRLGSLTPGLSQPELAVLQQNQTIHQIIHNPILAPYKLLELAVLRLHFSSAWAFRSISAGFAAISIVLFFFILKRWHTHRIALLGTALFASSSWFLHSARLATPDILFAFGSLALISYGIWLLRITYTGRVIPFGLILAAFLLYIPGMVWLLVPAAIWWWKPIWKKFKQTPLLPKLLGLVVGLGLTSPLAWAIYRQPSLLKAVLGLPETFPHLATVLHNLAIIPTQLVFHGPSNPTLWLGRLPLLDAFTLVMILLGSYAYFFQFTLDRTRLLLGAMALSISLIALHGPVNLLLLAPCLFIVATAGLALMLQQWFTVFPRNPIARTLGLSLLVLAVALTCVYNLDSYFVAWSQAPATKQAFTKRL